MDFSPEALWHAMSWPVRGTFAFMVILSIWLVYVVIERFLVYGKASTQSVSYVLALRDHLAKRRVDDALKAAQLHAHSPVAKVIESGLRALKGGRDALHNEGPDDVGHFDIVDSVNRAMDRVKERETSNLRKGLSGLASIASATPFIGLFGTVLGIINAFDLLKKGTSIETIGPAIAEALFATAVGLLIAIPAAMFFNYFTTRVENMVVDMNDVASEFIDFVLREGRT
jgi:biopolymer transport protein ExbB/TolQ